MSVKGHGSDLDEAISASGGICSPVVPSGWQRRIADYGSLLPEARPVALAMPTFRVPLREGQPGYEEQEERYHWIRILEVALGRLCTCRSCSCHWCEGHTAGCVIHDLDFDDD